MASLFFLATACQPAGYGRVGISVDGQNTGDEIPGDDPDEASSDAEAAFGLAALGVKNHLQIYESMWAATALETITSLPRSDGTFSSIRNFYNSAKPILPTNNDIKSFTPSHRLTISNLAWEFCDRALELSVVRAHWFSGTIFAEMNNNTLHRPSEILVNPNQRELLATRLLHQLWGEEIVASPHRSQAVSELANLAADLMVGASADAQSSRSIVKGVCTAALSSAAVSLL
jgi:hypothetical protein